MPHSSGTFLPPLFLCVFSPFRAADDLFRSHNTAAGREDQNASNLGQGFGRATRPKSALASQGGLFLQGKGKQRTRSTTGESFLDKRHWQAHARPSSPQQHQQNKRQQKADATRLPAPESTGSTRSSLLRPVGGVEHKEAQPSSHVHRESKVATAVERNSARSSESPRGPNAAVNTANALPAVEVRHVSKRPSTAPAAVDQLPERAPHVRKDEPDMGLEREIQGPTAEPAECEEPANSCHYTEAGQSITGNNSHRSARSAGYSRRNGGSGGGSFAQTPGDSPEEVPPAKPGDVPDVTTDDVFDTEYGLHSRVNLRPATAEASRRPSIEADAALLRSPRLLAPSRSEWPRSEGVLGALSGSMIGIRGGSRESNGDERGRTAHIGEGHLGTTESSAEKGDAGDVSLMTWNGLSVKSWADSSQERCKIGGSVGHTNKEMKRRHLRKRGTGPGFHKTQHHQGKRVSASGSGSVRNTSKTTEDDLSRPSASSATALHTAWTQWSRPGDLGELDSHADQTHGANVRGGLYVARRAKNGVATGASWGGYDQVHSWGCLPPSEELECVCLVAYTHMEKLFGIIRPNEAGKTGWWTC